MRRTARTTRIAPTPARLAVLVAAFLMLAAGCTNSSDDADAQVDINAIPLTAFDGGSTTLADFEGTPLVVNFFAAWCAPCRAEIPDIEAISVEFAGEVTVLGVSRDLDEDTWKALIEETGLTYPTVFEGQTGALFEAVNGLGMPTTVFIDADGTLLRTVAGLQTEDSLRDLIETEF